MNFIDIAGFGALNLERVGCFLTKEHYWAGQPDGWNIFAVVDGKFIELDYARTEAEALEAKQALDQLVLSVQRSK